MYIPFGLLRLLLATFVFFVHTEQVMPLAPAYVNWAGLGVWMFFIVSGYVIISAYDNFYRGRAVAFLVNRGVRIYPTLWLCLLGSLVLLQLNASIGLPVEGIHFGEYGIREFVLGLSIIGGFVNDQVWNPLAPAATLTVEMKFYLVAGLVFFAVDRLNLPMERSLFWAAVVFLGAALLVHATGSQFRWFGALRYAPVFIAGGLIYFATRLGWTHRGIVVLLVLTAPLFVHFMLSGDSSTGYAGFGITPSRAITATSVLGLLGIMAWLSYRSPDGRIKRADRFLGDLTYPLYLVQVPLLGVLLPTAQWSGPGDWIMLYAINLFAALAINLALERPLLAIRRRVRGRSIGT